MSKKQQKNSKRHHTTAPRNVDTSHEPLFVHLDEYNGFPEELTQDSISTLRHMMAAWTTFVERLQSSPQPITEKIAFYITRTLLHRGIAHVFLEEWGAAIADLSDVIAHHAKEAETNTAYYYRAQAYDALDRREASQGDWTQVLTAIEGAASHPERFSKEMAAHGYAYRARIACRQKKYEQAIQDCDRALAWDDTCAEAYSVRGRAKSILHQKTTALADCTRAITLDSSAAVHYYRRALVHISQGHHRLAQDDFQQALAREPDNPQIQKDSLLHSTFLLLTSEAEDANSPLGEETSNDND